MHPSPTTSRPLAWAIDVEGFQWHTTSPGGLSLVTLQSVGLESFIRCLKMSSHRHNEASDKYWRKSEATWLSPYCVVGDKNAKTNGPRRAFLLPVKLPSWEGTEHFEKTSHLTQTKYWGCSTPGPFSWGLLLLKQAWKSKVSLVCFTKWHSSSGHRCG